MEVKLESLFDRGLQVGYGIKYLSKGEVIEADFSELGVKLLLDNVWSNEFRYRDIDKIFKIYGQ